MGCCYSGTGGVFQIGAKLYSCNPGDVVFINLPGEGDEVTVGDTFGDIESVKAVSDICSPVSGTIVAVNEELADAPETLNKDPYGAWIIKVENITDEEALLDAEAYEAHCAEEG